MEPTEKQIKAANEAEMAKWGEDFPTEQLKVPYSREEKEEDTEEEGEENEEVPEDIDYTEPEPILKTEDPGEYVPNDYSFDVTIEGKTTKIKTPEQAAEFADEHAEEFTAKELLSFMRNANKMESNLEKDLSNWQSQKDKYESEMSEENNRQETINSLANEIQYMISKGLLPDIEDDYKNADWTDPQVAKQPGVREQIELINYMTKENNSRAKAGVKPFSSVMDAYNSMMLEKGKDEKAEARERSNQARKAVANTVAAPTPSVQGIQTPKGISVGNPNVFKRNNAIWE